MTAPLPWPTKDEYDRAIKEWSRTLHDPELQRSQLHRRNDLGDPSTFGGAALYVRVYRLGDWMVRCFCSTPAPQRRDPPADIRERYKAIARFSHDHADRAPALLKLGYLDRGITVGQRTVPLVKMPFVANAAPLGTFVEEHRQDGATMLRLSESWRQMVLQLENVGMAHGDLDLTNVLVAQHGGTLALKLIDYDNAWVPALKGKGQTEYGHETFQHPAFQPPNARPYNAEMDRFSALVIYLSLRALAAVPMLYDQWGADEAEQLLLKKGDYERYDLESGRIMQLRKRCGPELHPYVDELRKALRESRMPRSLAQIPLTTSPPVQPVRPVRPARPARPVRGTVVEHIAPDVGRTSTPPPPPPPPRTNLPPPAPRPSQGPTPQLNKPPTPQPARFPWVPVLWLTAILGIVVLLALSGAFS